MRRCLSLLLQKRKLVLFIYDVMSFIVFDAVYYLASILLDASPTYKPLQYIINSAILIVIIFAYRLILHVYKYVWRYPNTMAYLKLVVADMFGGITGIVISRIITRVSHGQVYSGVWHFAYVSSATLIFSLLSRFVYRIIYKRIHFTDDKQTDRPHINIAIVGAGQVGSMLANDLMCNKYSIYTPKFFLDIDPSKVGNKIVGLKVFKDSDDIAKLIKEYEISEFVIAMKNINSEKADALYNIYSSTGCIVKLYDAPIHESDVNDSSRQRVIRQFQIEDLLFRKEVSLTDSNAYRYYAGKTVLITGGGGSIGSEICRQIAKSNPKKLVIFDIYENNAYEIEQELSRTYGDYLNLAVEIGSVRDTERLEAVFKAYSPDIVFHAAAHKHVPLMEHCGSDAIKNNVFGTYNAANFAEKYGVEKFILISTDKAVNPTNIMGASKRVCEMIVQSRTDSKTNFSAVRFGNVLGSNGSVIPLFKRQIANGGPVTITDKRIIRYFMTIPEASQLVIQAGAMAERGELFVLDMGKPVKIYDLAKSMIRLSGFEPERDIQIKEIGLRPGEKLYEELLMKTENLKSTHNKMIFIEKDEPLTRDEVEKKLDILKAALSSSVSDIGSEKIVAALKNTVPTYRSPEDINDKFKS